MARGSARSRGRGARSSTRRQSAPRDFDENWLSDIRERFDARYIDLTRYEDRRRWHPDNLKPYTQQPLPRTLRGRAPRIVIVPERHRLAKYATYGEKYKLGEVYARKRGLKRHLMREWEETPLVDKYGHGYSAKLFNTRISPRVGFHLPWQVIICVRRQKRREVMHALNFAGKSGLGRGKKQNRNRYSEVRC